VLDDMNSSSSDTAFILRLVFDCLLIIFGVVIFSGVLKVQETNIWLPILILLVGLFTLSTPAAQNSASSMMIGVLLMGVGLFLILRFMGIIDIAWLRYIISGFIILVGVVNMARNLHGQQRAVDKTFTSK